jgi:hypothetical protein
MGNYDFKRDLAVAKNTEKRVALILEHKFGYKVTEYNKDNKYDLAVETKNEDLVTIEVKEDFMCKLTGNVALEFECRGKLSGINVSEADYYIYVIHRKTGIEYWSLKIKTLKEMIKNKEYFRIVNGGDKGSNTMNYLFKYKTFIKNGFRLA